MKLEDLTLPELIQKQRSDLNDGNVTEALKILDEIEERFERANAWRWLQRNRPESYEQLIKKVKQAAERRGYSPGGQSELLQLAWVLEWCQEHGQ